MNDFLGTPIEYLKGVGAKRAELLKKELRIASFEDLLYHFPFRYVDRTAYQKVVDIQYWDTPVQLKGKIISLKVVGVGRKKRMSANFEDETGCIELIWFQGVDWVKKSIEPNRIYQIYGRAKKFGTGFNIAHPEVTPWEDVDKTGGMQGVYSSTEKLNDKGLHTKGISKIAVNLVEGLKGKVEEPLPKSIIDQYRLVSLEEALIQIHRPDSEDEVRKAIFRLKFEELFFLQMELLHRKQISFEKGSGFVFPKLSKVFNTFYTDHLPFNLTDAQKRVIKEIRKDVTSGKHMNRLLQGDVGSGKTFVALLAALMAIDNDFQAAIIAPTEILATQHYEGISEMLKPLGVKVGLLKGSVRKKQREVLHEQLRSGEMHLLIGTHALLENEVRFQNLGLVVIDEQHRFGVAQRAKMWLKNVVPPHVLIMTATPIPRTLAMTFYGDLDVSVIDELPPGRKPIKTSHRYETNRIAVFKFMKQEIALGRQIYIVYPLIKESETLDLNNLMDGFEAISRSFPLPEYKVSIVHGQMKADAKQFEMNRFVKGETNIMVATTVIEVGVNVPNASVMIIENTERFGLSQLHQLRGRVGRGADKSYCILMSSYKISKEAKKRIETMVRTQDGFEIAEVDLEIRGPGDIMGTQQSGDLNLKLADLAADGVLVGIARDVARDLLKRDEKLQLVENGLIREKLNKILRSRPEWGKIS
ncbi:MAG: ATP-dependent DNA helicase RecG [Crocinitomicaceae bacterium]